MVRCQTSPTQAHLDRWRELEIAKHRLFYSLLRWNLPVKTRAEDPDHGLIFNFLADDLAAGEKVMTGHDNGLITIALSEADDSERERRRLAMGEPYRTLLGHFRHEVGHYFWDVLVRDGGKLDACRQVFGDDLSDYDHALQRHYTDGAPADWQQHFVSAYATSHPWEDFAETWAHYLHIVDTLEMAGEFGIEVRPPADAIGGLTARVGFDPYRAGDFDAIVIGLAAVHLRHEQRQPRHGRSRTLSLHPVAPSHWQTRLYPPPRAGRGKGERGGLTS